MKKNEAARARIGQESRATRPTGQQGDSFRGWYAAQERFRKWMPPADVSQWLAPFELPRDFAASVEDRVREVSAARREGRFSQTTIQTFGTTDLDARYSKIRDAVREQVGHVSKITLDSDGVHTLKCIEVARQLSAPLYPEELRTAGRPRLKESLRLLGGRAGRAAAAIERRCRIEGSSLVGHNRIGELSGIRFHLLDVSEGIVGQRTPLVFWLYESPAVSLDEFGMEELGVFDDVVALMHLYYEEVPLAAKGLAEGQPSFSLPADLPRRLASLGEAILTSLKRIEGTTPPTKTSRGDHGEQNGTPAPPAFQYRDEHLTILSELAATDRLMTAAELDGKSGMPAYDRLGDLLGELEGASPPLVIRPRGPRSGYAVSPEGINELTRRKLIDPST